MKTRRQVRIEEGPKGVLFVRYVQRDKHGKHFAAQFSEKSKEWVRNWIKNNDKIELVEP